MLELDLADARVEPAISAIAARGHPFAPDGSPALGSACPSLNDYDVAELRSAEVESIALARVTSKRSMGGVGTSSARGTLYVRLRGWEPTRTKIKCVGGVSETVGVGWTVASNRSTPIAPPVPPLRLDGTISPIFPLHLRDLHNEVSLSELDAYRSSL
ncbi:uncharacterized protein JCM10292_001763, partial [Rhodotorula paludigena]|uniref:uncharacterized protein n=1 Tax=Rhodotorula paludigena TaxID=86838 RepID=UPI00317A29FD